MNFDRFNVFVGDECVAENMCIKDACIFIEGLYREYYNDNIIVSIHRYIKEEK